MLQRSVRRPRPRTKTRRPRNDARGTTSFHRARSSVRRTSGERPGPQPSDITGTAAQPHSSHSPAPRLVDSWRRVVVMLLANVRKGLCRRAHGGRAVQSCLPVRSSGDRPAPSWARRIVMRRLLTPFPSVPRTVGITALAAVARAVPAQWGYQDGDRAGGGDRRAQLDVSRTSSMTRVVLV